uniref:PiggyBac transposable element-derived protein domain-containing protein n=1 Tax=Glossina morsitans morsitans TaxID=37546 RepID=A0A1B0GDJ7_GLOMM
MYNYQEKRRFSESSDSLRYAIKFYELCAHDGYALNLDIYKGKVKHEVSSLSVVDSVVMRLMEPHLLKGHSLFMDNYYKSVGLSNRLLSFKTHTTRTLRTNRKMNPKVVTQKKLKKGEHIYVYISKWKDKRDVLCITTENHPKLIDVHNKYAYYSSSKKSIRWYKKVIFHLLDISLWNSFYIYKKISDSNIGFLDFRDNLINMLLKIPQNSNASDFFLDNDNSQTHNCVDKPPVCPGECFRQWHLPPEDHNSSNLEIES